MKKIIFALSFVGMMSSCLPTKFQGQYSPLNQTQVVLSSNNFKVLGSFAGVATDKKIKFSVKNKEGLIARAKADMLDKAKAAGVTLEGGSRALVNVTVDVIQNAKKITATVSAEIIEFK
jgi:hypothetical protein